MPKYAGICATMSKYTLMVFVLHFLGGPLEHVVTNFNVYPKLEWSLRGRNMRIFSWKGFDFSYSSWKYLICFLF